MPKASKHPAPQPSTRIFVLDTNVLMHDPSSLFRFHEHDIVIPLQVLEELDAAKKGQTEVSRNVRQVSRTLDQLLREAGQDLSEGIALHAVPPPHNVHANRSGGDPRPTGRLYFQTEAVGDSLSQLLPTAKADNTILAVAQQWQNIHAKRQVTLVSKDINLRLKAKVIGLHAEDYTNDQVLDDLALLYSGCSELPEDFWKTHSKGLQSWQENGRTFYAVNGPLVSTWRVNQFVYLPEEGDPEFIVRHIDGEDAELELLHNYREGRKNVWGVHAKNREQNFALHLLLDTEIDFVSLAGAAGTGKTLLTLAAALSQTLDHRLFREIIMTRVTVPLGEDIGFLPGTEEEKMTPWMGALMDNLEALTQGDNHSGHQNSHNTWGDWEKNVTQDLLAKRIKIRSLNFMRGRTFLQRFLILDEAQNLTAKQMRALVTRAGFGTKVVCLGNLAQIDTPYLTETTSGLAYAIERFAGWPHSGHITLARGERSRLAAYAADAL